MNCELQEKADKILGEILALLNEERRSREIDEPLDRSAESFLYDGRQLFTHRLFTRVTAEYVQHLYRSGLRFPRELSDAQAHAEAVSLLAGYQGRFGAGYDAALLEAKSDGVDVVLAGLLEAIKARENEKYARWVFAKLIDPSDWELRCLLAERALSLWVPFVNTDLAECVPAQFACDYAALLGGDLGSENLLNQIVRGALRAF